jgi:long-subunit fatty acid transport protein
VPATRFFKHLTPSISLPSAGIVLSLLVSVNYANPPAANAQATSFQNGLSAAAEARGGNLATQVGDPLDAVQGNPAGLAGVTSRTAELGAVGVFGSGSFQNSANTNGRMSGTVGAMPFAAYAAPLRSSRWVAAAAFTPEILMRANWRYVDAPGTLGVTYGLQTNEAQIIAVRYSLGAARTFGSKWSAGAVLGLVYNTNNLTAPYIFQQQPQLAGLKVLLTLHTHGIGWNGNAGIQFHPTDRLRLGLAWKSGTTIHTTGDASGTASALFAALGVTADPNFSYLVQVENHLPQAFDIGASFRTGRHLTWQAQTDFTAWGQAFQQLPVTLTQGTNATINSVVGANSLRDAVPLHWNNQLSLHAGVESPIGERWTLRAGYSYQSNPVPSATLLPVTAAIMQNAIATGIGWSHRYLHIDAAYQAQLPSTESVGNSSILAGEYSNSRVRLSLQSVTATATLHF